MIYLDNAATTMPKPPAVGEAMCAALTECGNPSRGAHGAALAALRLVEEVRGRIAAYFGVGDSARVVFTQNATHALNIAIQGVRGHIVTTAADHNSVLRPVRRRGDYTIVPVDENGGIDPDAIERAMRPGEGAVVMTHASNVTGTVYDVAAIAERCRRRSVRFILDAAQTAGLIPVDMAGLGIDALCCSGHKSIYGPQGVGALCLGEGFVPGAIMVGGSGSDSFSEVHPESLPEALEAGTVNMPGIAGLGAGVDYVAGQGGQCFAQADRLARRFAAGVMELDGYRVYGDMGAELRTPVVAVAHGLLDSAEIAYRLWEEYGIAVRAGVHCAPLMHRGLNIGDKGVVRFSFSHFNTQDEVAYALAALRHFG